MSKRPLLMIPGPIEVSPTVLQRMSVPPPGHLAPPLIEAFGRSIERMREVWLAGPKSQPFIVAGGGTTAMEIAAANLVEPGDRVIVVHTGYFSSRMAEMLRRQGADVLVVDAEPGDAPSDDEVASAVDRALASGKVKALFATHVDTSTGVRIDPRPLATIARQRGILSIFDGVCATAGEPFRMADWGVDCYLTASQKAIGIPPGLALLVAGPRALAARASRAAGAPPMVLDWNEWLPVMQAYEERRPAYFSTPATNLILALDAGLEEILAPGIEARIERHARVADAMRAAWTTLGLSCVPSSDRLTANTLSALFYPEGIDATLVGRIADRGVVVAGGLHPEIRDRYFRVGHMGWVTTQPALLRRTVEAIALGLRDSGASVDPEAGLAALGSLADGLTA